MDKWLCDRWAVWMLLLVVPAILLLSGCTDSENRQGSAGSDPDKKHNIIKRDGRIHFTLGDREFNVPEGNFKGGGETGGGQLIQVSLWGLLPDFEGYDKAKNHAEFIGPRQKRGRDARIELYRRADRITVLEMVSRRDQMKNHSAFSGRLGDYDELRYGLEYYRSDNRSDDIYLYIEDDDPEVFIRCPSESVLKTMPFPSCTYYWDISAGTSYQMRYSMDYLPQWREIWGEAQQLVGGQK